MVHHEATDLTDLVTPVLRVPLRLISEALETARMAFATRFSELPPIRRFGRAEQSGQIPPAPGSGFAASKAGRNAAVGIFTGSAEVTVGAGHEPPPRGLAYHISVAVVLRIRIRRRGTSAKGERSCAATFADALRMC